VIFLTVTDWDICDIAFLRFADWDICDIAFLTVTDWDICDIAFVLFKDWDICDMRHLRHLGDAQSGVWDRKLATWADVGEDGSVWWARLFQDERLAESCNVHGADPLSMKGDEDESGSESGLL
jgi:hypothetical protein